MLTVLQQYNPIFYNHRTA